MIDQELSDVKAIVCSQWRHFSRMTCQHCFVIRPDQTYLHRSTICLGLSVASRFEVHTFEGRPAMSVKGQHGLACCSTGAGVGVGPRPGGNKAGVGPPSPFKAKFAVLASCCCAVCRCVCMLCRQTLRVPDLTHSSAGVEQPYISLI